MWYEEDYVRMRDNGLLPWLVVEFGDDYDSSPLGQRYLAAFYWSFTTMSTVGYGDITATTSMERMFAIVSMITGSFFFSVIMTHVMTELENSNMHHNALNHKMYTVKMFVNDLQLNKTERRSVLGYFRTQDVKPYDERELLFEMPFDMRNRILQYLYKDLFANVPIFMNSDDVYKTELCSRCANIIIAIIMISTCTLEFCKHTLLVSSMRYANYYYHYPLFIQYYYT
jgi:hypothetical protein